VQGCLSCVETVKCVIKDEMQEIHRKLLESGGITWAPSVHTLKITTLAKIAMDRILALLSPQMQMTSKVGGLIVVAQHDWMSVANLSVCSVLIRICFSLNLGEHKRHGQKVLLRKILGAVDLIGT
jgi:multimeric flavodoxin WrbA